MAHYVTHNSTGELIYLSDFEPPNDQYTGQGHHAHETNLSVTEIENNYFWSPNDSTFVRKDPRVLTKLQFLKKFTPIEYSNIKNATSQNGVLDYYWQIFMVSENIDLKNLDIIEGINLMQQLQLISSDRVLEILNG